jgi:hypothetical protein
VSKNWELCGDSQIIIILLSSASSKTVVSSILALFDGHGYFPCHEGVSKNLIWELRSRNDVSRVVGLL